MEAAEVRDDHPIGYNGGNTNLLRFVDTSKVFQASLRTQKVVLRSVSWSLRPAQVAVIEGQNGAGKSTLLGLAAGLIRPTRGTVTVFGQPAGTPSALRRIGWQSESPRFPERLTVEACLQEHLEAFGTPRSESEARVSDLLDVVGLAQERSTVVRDCSAGMRQRLAIARAVAHRPILLLLDEPFSALDQDARPLVSWAVSQVLARGGGGIVVTHHTGILPELQASSWRLEGGRLFAKKATEQ